MQTYQGLVRWGEVRWGEVSLGDMVMKGVKGFGRLWGGRVDGVKESRAEECPPNYDTFNDLK